MSAITQSDNIETLTLDYEQFFIKDWVADIATLLEYSKTLTHLTIIRYGTPQNDSLTVNTSVRQFKYSWGDMDQKTTLKFLDRLKQAYTVE